LQGGSSFGCFCAPHNDEYWIYQKKPIVNQVHFGNLIQLTHKLQVVDGFRPHKPCNITFVEAILLLTSRKCIFFRDGKEELFCELH
jgi:hypothetical protein